MLTIEDIKIDYEITRLLRQKAKIIQNRIETLDKDAESLKDVAVNYMKIKQRENAKNMLKRKVLCVKQQTEYKRKLQVIETAIQNINDTSYGDIKEDNNDDNGGGVLIKDDEFKVEGDIGEDTTDLSELGGAANDEDIESRLKAQTDELNAAMGNILNSDYTKWTSDDIVLWIVSLRTDEFLKYEALLKQGMMEKKINGSQLAMITKNDLLEMKINENDAAIIHKEIELLVSCYNEDLMDELYDDDEE